MLVFFKMCENVEWKGCLIGENKNMVFNIIDKIFVR